MSRVLRISPLVRLVLDLLLKKEGRTVCAFNSAAPNQNTDINKRVGYKE